MSSLEEVAARAGVSKATASRALSGHPNVSAATRERVRDAAAELNYVVSASASSLVTGRTRTVGLVLPRLDRWFFARLVDGVESTLIAAGYDLTLYRLSDDPELRRRIFDYFLVRKRVDAVIAVSVHLSADEIAMLHALGKPTAGVGGPMEHSPSVRIDDFAAARVATEHLLALGHRRVTHLGGDSDAPIEFAVHTDRLAGFRAAMREAGAEAGAGFRNADYSVRDGHRAALALLAEPDRPTAVMAAADEVAFGVLLAAQQLGIRVPEELSVIGIDDHDFSEAFGLTTMRQDPQHQGRLAAELALAGLAGNGPTAAEEHVLPTALQLRSSTARPHRG